MCSLIVSIIDKTIEKYRFFFIFTHHYEITDQLSIRTLAPVSYLFIYNLIIWKILVDDSAKIDEKQIRFDLYICNNSAIENYYWWEPTAWKRKCLLKMNNNISSNLENRICESNRYCEMKRKYFPTHKSAMEFHLFSTPKKYKYVTLPREQLKAK